MIKFFSFLACETLSLTCNLGICLTSPLCAILDISALYFLVFQQFFFLACNTGSSVMDYLPSMHNTLNSMPEPHKSAVTHGCNRSTEDVGSREPELECYCLSHSMILAWES